MLFIGSSIFRGLKRKELPQHSYVKTLDNKTIHGAAEYITHLYREGHTCDKIVFQIGSNDLVRCGVITLLNKYRALLDLTKVLWPQAKAHICGLTRRLTCPRDYNQKRAECNYELAKIKQCQFIETDLTKDMLDRDGIHPNRAGTCHITNRILEHLFH